MSSEHAPRRGVAEIRWDDDPGPIARIGTRSLHHFWPLLAPYFRDVLLPPQRRAEEPAVTWTWHEPAEAAPISPSELRALRKWLADAQQLLVENLAAGNAEEGGLRAQVNTGQLGSVMGDVVARLVGCSDAELAAYACRTDAGPRLHSWGASSPACPAYPDTTGLEIAGRVLVGGQPARLDVVLESGEGETLAETPSDSAGEFRFPGLSPGSYRLRARSGRRTFPANGLGVVLARKAVTDIVLADSDAASSLPAAGKSAAARGRPRRALVITLALLALGGSGAAWGWRMWQAGTSSTAARRDGPSRGQQEDARERAVASTRTRSAKTAALDPAAADVRARVETRASKTATEANDSAAREGTDMFATPRSPGPPHPVDDESARRSGIRKETSAPPGEQRGQPAQASGLPASSGVASDADPATAATGTSASAISADATVDNRAITSPSPASASEVQLPPPSAETPAPALDTSDPPAPPSASPPSASKPPLVDNDPANIEAPPLEEPIPPGVPESAKIQPTQVNDVAQATPSVDALESDAESESTTSAPEPALSSTAAENPDEPSRSRIVADEPVEGGDPGSSPRSEVTGESISRVIRALPVRLARTVRVRSSPWRPRVIGDAILPTQPVPTGRFESIAAVRQRVIAEQKVRLPRLFRDPDVQVEFLLDWPLIDSRDSLVWVDAGGGRVPHGHVEAGRATLRCPEGHGTGAQTYRLVRPDGAALAEVQIEPAGGDFTLRTIEGFLPSLRIVLRSAKFESARSPDAGSIPARYTWRTASGAPPPVTWRTETVNHGGRDEYRLEIPLGGAPGAVAFQACALFNPETGWAVLSEIRQAADRPLGR